MELEAKTYTTMKEKEALFYIESDDFTYSGLLELLTGIKEKSELKAKYLLFKARAKSVGEVIEVQYKCEHCGGVTFSNINIENILGKPFYEELGDELVDDDDIEKLYDIENMSIKEYDEIHSKYDINNNSLMNPNQPATCMLCGQDTVIEIIVKEIISKTSLKDLYSQVAQLTYYTNNGYIDVMSMLPFERELMINLINNIREEEQ